MVILDAELGVDWKPHDFAGVVATTRKHDGKFDALSAVLCSHVWSILLWRENLFKHYPEYYIHIGGSVYQRTQDYGYYLAFAGL